MDASARLFDPKRSRAKREIEGQKNLLQRPAAAINHSALEQQARGLIGAPVDSERSELSEQVAYRKGVIPAEFLERQVAHPDRDPIWDAAKLPPRALHELRLPEFRAANSYRFAGRGLVRDHLIRTAAASDRPHPFTINSCVHPDPLTGLQQLCRMLDGFERF